ncbi:MAG: response regulator [Candidatus Angelobacter sp.]
MEDNKLTRMVHERSLIRAGYSVVTAKDGEEALELARHEEPDVVLLDMMLPKLSGPQVLRQLKVDAQTRRIPVVVLTGLSQKNEGRLLEDGAAAFVEKNAVLENPTALLSVLHHTLRAVASAARIAEPSALVKEPSLSSASSARH